MDENNISYKKNNYFDTKFIISISTVILLLLLIISFIIYIIRSS